MHKIPCADVVVFLPGIMGSELRKNGRTVWAETGGAVFDLLRSHGEDLTSLALSQDGGSDEAAGDGVTVGAMMRDLHLIPGLWKIDGYTKACDFLLSRFDLTPGESFFPFPYDWRRDNRFHARRLLRQSHDWLKARREKTGNPDARLVLLAHSMGGLIARYFLEVLEGWRVTRSLVTFGTPHLGSANSLRTLHDGVKVNLGGKTLLDLTPLARSCPSIHQLLPVYGSLDLGDGKLTRLSDTAAHGLDLTRVHDARDFHREIRDAAAANRQISDYRDNGYDLHAIIGTHQPTLQSAKLENGSLTLLESILGNDESGDGTVPRLAAVPAGENAREVLVVEKHGGLHNHDFSLLQLEGIIGGRITAATGPLLSFAAGEPEPSPVSLRMEDAYRRTEPITIAARPMDEGIRLTAQLTDKHGSPVAIKPLSVGDEGWQSVEVQLAAGTYRVRVSGPGASTVSDVFVVD